MKIILLDDQSNTIGETSIKAIKGDVISVKGYDGIFHLGMILDDVGFAYRISEGMNEEYLNQIDCAENFARRKLIEVM